MHVRSLEPPLLPAVTAIGSALFLSGHAQHPLIPASLNPPSTLLTVAPKNRAATLGPLLGPGKVLSGS